MESSKNVYANVKLNINGELVEKQILLSLLNENKTNNVIFVLKEEYKKDLVSIYLPYGVASLGTKAFANCENLKSVTLPESV